LIEKGADGLNEHVLQPGQVSDPTVQGVSAHAESKTLEPSSASVSGAKTAQGNPYRYPPKRRGWTCFHCNETFTTWGSAEDHFGKTPDTQPGCLIKIRVGDERGLLMELRKAEARAEEMYQRARAAERESEMLAGENAALKDAAKAHSAHDLRMKLDSMEGRVITADALIKAILEKAPEVYAEVIG
jgi:hypothetical protein